MKLTWFGGRALRIHIGGKMLVCEPESAGREVNRAELVSGADGVFLLDPGPGSVDAARWQPRPLRAAIADEGPEEVLVHPIGHESAIIDAVGEPPLLILGAATTPRVAGRWTAETVVVVFDGYAATGALLDLAPRLIAIAENGRMLDVAIDTLRDKLNGTRLMALEPGMALEV